MIDYNIDEPDPHPWRGWIITLAVILALVLTWVIWAGLTPASAAGGCGGG